MNIQAVKAPSMISTHAVGGTAGAAVTSEADPNLSEFITKRSTASLPQRSKTVTRKNISAGTNLTNGYSSASDQSITDLYDKLDQMSVSSDEFYANLLSMSDDSLELGSIDGDDGDVIIQGTEMITSSFFYSTGRRMNTEKRRRGKKKSKSINEFNKGTKGVAATSTTSPSDDPANVTADGVVPVQVVVGASFEISDSVPVEQHQLEQQEEDVLQVSSVNAAPQNLAIAVEETHTKKNGIRFVVDEVDNIVPEIVYIDRIEHEYHSDVYYDENEHSTMKIDAYFFAEDYMIDNCIGMTCISQIVDDALNCPFNFSGWNKHVNNYNFQRILYNWCNDTGRGLESFVTPTLQMTSTSTVQSILAYQNRLMSTAGKSSSSSSSSKKVVSSTNPVSKSERRYLLAQESIRRTEGSIRLAHVLALGDQLIVQQQYEEENKTLQQHSITLKNKDMTASSSTTSRINSNIFMKTSYWISKLSGSGSGGAGNNSNS